MKAAAAPKAKKAKKEYINLNDLRRWRRYLRYEGLDEGDGNDEEARRRAKGQEGDHKRRRRAEGQEDDKEGEELDNLAEILALGGNITSPGWVYDVCLKTMRPPSGH